MGSFLQLCNTSLENTNEVMRAIVIIVRAVNLEERRRAEVRRRRRGERGAHRSLPSNSLAAVQVNWPIMSELVSSSIS